jgi:hypothetical protein
LRRPPPALPIGRFERDPDAVNFRPALYDAEMCVLHRLPVGNGKRVEVGKLKIERPPQVVFDLAVFLREPVHRPALGKLGPA